MKITSVAVRDTIQWATGLGLAVWETIGHDEPRLIVLAFAGILMGLPGFVGLLHLRSTGGLPPANQHGGPVPRSSSPPPSSSS